MPRIEKVEARSVRVPLDRPTAFARRLVDARWYTLVRVHGDDGSMGIGFCYGGHVGGDLVTKAVQGLLAAELIGADTHDLIGHWDHLYQHALLLGRTGAVMRALSAVDIALWDLNARSSGLPLSKFLGSTGSPAVKAYASGGYYLGGKSVKDLAAEVQGYIDLGFDAVKMKVGRAEIHHDSERIAAVRDVLGPTRLLMLDANNAWRDFPTAARAMEAWSQYDIYWIEEPFSPDDISNHARLAASTPVKVATGEIEAGRWRHLELLRQSAISILQADAAVCGGITEFMRIAHTADSFGVQMAPHWFHDLHVHLVAAISNGAWVEYFPGPAILNFHRLVDTQLEIEPGGLLRVPSGPGLGFGFVDAEVEANGSGPWA